MVALLLWSLSVAFGRNVAVLPLEPGAKTEQYDGLGLAMAGMLVTDLTQVPGLDLIERAQIDKVIAEVELGKKGYVDPKTAAEVGRLVGAEWMVVGTWSVIEPQFLLSVRAVDVKTGKVLGSASTQGTVQDFVTVEKDAVEQLLTSIQVELTGGTRRKILAGAPTESFEAMSTYAEGLAAEQSEDYAKAKERFEAAAKADPGFDLPGQRLASLQGKLARLEEARVANRADAKEQLVLSVLAKTPDELSLTKKSSPDELAELEIRWILLRELGRSCQLTDEIRHALDRHDGKMPTDGQSNLRLHEAAFRLGLYDERPHPSPNGVVLAPRSTGGRIVSDKRIGLSTRNLVMGIVDGVDRAENKSGLVNFAITCAGGDPVARVGAITRVQDQVRRLGIGDARGRTYGGAATGVPLGIELEVLELDARVRVEGMSARVAKRLDALVAISIDHDTDYAIRAKVKAIGNDAKLYASRQAVLEGLDMDRVATIVRAAVQKSPPVQFDTPACRPIADDSFNLEPFEKAMADGYAELEEQSRVMSAIVRAQKLRLLGCVQGEPGMLDTDAKALAWLDTFPSRFRTPGDPDCMADHVKLLESNASRRTPHPREPEFYANHIVREGLWKMVKTGCASIGQ